MICQTKHTFLDSQYILQIENNQIEIGKRNKVPKYIIPLNLTMTVQWMIEKKKMELTGFAIKIKEKIKKFYMNHQDSLNLKKQIDGKVIYNEINSLYFPIQVIGEGSFGKVVKVVNLVDKQEYACKVMKLDKQFDKNDIIYELKIMQSLRNENIIKIKEVFSSKSHFFIIMEYCKGGSLKDYLICNQLHDDQIVQIIKTILKAVIYMNEQGFIHRDLKPENILLRKEKDFLSLLICDFGFAAKIEDISTKHPNCGTPGYIAPEVVKYDENNPYNHQCDVFSCGSIFYTLLTGKTLSVSSDIDMVYSIDEQNLLFNDQFNNIKKEYQDIIFKMLNNDPLERITAIDALKYIEEIDEIVTEDDCVTQQIKTISIKKKFTNYI